MQYRTSIVLALLAAGCWLLTSGCGEPEQSDGDSCPSVVKFAFNPTTGECIEYDCADRPSGLEGSYDSQMECRRDIGSKEPDSGMDAGMDVSDDEDASQPDDGGGSSDTTSDEDTGLEDTSPDEDMSTADTGDSGSSPSCQSVGKTACFSNLDCSSGQRCENVEAAESRCCVDGERGDKTAGESCSQDDGQFECESGICISKRGSDKHRCSTTCEADDDCPEGMKQCTTIFGSQNKWCFPE